MPETTITPAAAVDVPGPPRVELPNNAARRRHRGPHHRGGLVRLLDPRYPEGRQWSAPPAGPCSCSAAKATRRPWSRSGCPASAAGWTCSADRRVAIRAGEPVLAVQATTGPNGAARLAKAKAEPRLAIWVAAGQRFEVWRGPSGCQGEAQAVGHDAGPRDSGRPEARMRQQIRMGRHPDPGRRIIMRLTS